MKKIFALTTLAAVFFASSLTFAAPPAAGGVHVRGSVRSLKGGLLTVGTDSGQIIVQLSGKTPVVSVIPSDRAHIKEGSFLGIASVTGEGGAQQAREVVVFPEAARGAGEGSYDWDLPGTKTSRMTNGKAAASKMTNGTVAHSRMTNGSVSGSKMTNGTVRHSTGTSELTLEFKNGSGLGSQKISLPAGIPFVTFEPGHMSQLAPGAHVVVFGHRGTGGVVSADRVLVGKNGLVPPM